MSDRRAVVITASNRAAAGVYEDTGGPLIVTALREWGFEVGDPVVVPDGEPVEQALRSAVADGVAAVVTTGGTGISPTDETPERTRAVLTYEIPGLAEAIRLLQEVERPVLVVCGEKFSDKIGTVRTFDLKIGWSCAATARLPASTAIATTVVGILSMTPQL